MSWMKHFAHTSPSASPLLSCGLSSNGLSLSAPTQHFSKLAQQPIIPLATRLRPRLVHARVGQPCLLAEHQETRGSQDSSKEVRSTKFPRYSFACLLWCTLQCLLQPGIHRSSPIPQFLLSSSFTIPRTKRYRTSRDDKNHPMERRKLGGLFIIYEIFLESRE